MDPAGCYNAMASPIEHGSLQGNLIFRHSLLGAKIFQCYWTLAKFAENCSLKLFLVREAASLAEPLITASPHPFLLPQ